MISSWKDFKKERGKIMTTDKKILIDNMKEELIFYRDLWQEQKEKHINNETAFNYADGMLDGIKIALNILKKKGEYKS